MSTDAEVITLPGTKKKQREEDSEKEFRIPRYNVVLLDDDDHTYEYVIEMLRKLFGHSHEMAFQMACEVDNAGRVIVDTTVQPKNVMFPTDAKLIHRARERLVRMARAKVSSRIWLKPAKK